ncbi:MAG: cyclic nucleotide-binding domain-containing protein [Magnetococcales bacterium]|nr:cyclic nucleotide-binding domain-containing protein [Magnetococcales bacterium]NGZ25293.1 cyclic nucleotide-binding domain-containing protein [Magnetococcales bacterium]
MGYLIEELLSSVPLFANLPKGEKEQLSEMLHSFSNHETDEMIIQEGSHGTAFYILIRGEAKVTRKNKPNHELARLHKGDIFGEMSYLTGRERSTNVIAATRDVMVMKLTREMISKCGPQFRETIKDRLIDLLVQRINQMNDAR